MSKRFLEINYMLLFFISDCDIITVLSLPADTVGF